MQALVKTQAPPTKPKNQLKAYVLKFTDMKSPPDKASKTLTLYEQYGLAFEEWENDSESKVWDNAVGDGLEDETETWRHLLDDLPA